MDVNCFECNDVRVLECLPPHPPRDDRDAVELIRLAMERGAQCVAIPAERLGDDFFRLSTRIAGALIQKFVTYRMKLVVLGDISGYTAQSGALRDFVYESNRGDYLWFVQDRQELERRLGSSPDKGA